MKNSLHFFEILHCVQNDTAREFVILNGTQCSEVSHSANKEIFRSAQNDSNAVFFCALLFRGLKSAVHLFNAWF